MICDECSSWEYCDKCLKYMVDSENANHVFYDKVNGYWVCRTCKCKFLSLYDFICHRFIGYK